MMIKMNQKWYAAGSVAEPGLFGRSRCEGPAPY